MAETIITLNNADEISKANKAVEEIARLNAQIKELNAQVEASKKELKAIADGYKVDAFETDLYRVFWELVEKHTFDSKTFKKDHEDEYNEYLKSSVSTYFKTSVISG